MSYFSQFGQFPLAFGGAAISGEGAGYGFGDISEGEAIDLCQQAYDLGFRVFDSAPIYGFGLSEQRMGKAFKKMREKVVLVSKSGVTWDKNKRVDMTNDPLIAEKMLHQSLIDFDSDYIDLYMVHWPDSRVDIRKTMEVLAKARHQGKIRAIGLCNTNFGDLVKASEVEKVEVVQSQYNVFENQLENDLFPYLAKNKIDFMSWGTLDKGILTGRVTRDRKFEKSDARSWAPWWKQTDFETRYKILDKIRPLLEAQGFSGLDLALHHNLKKKEVTLLLCGARNNSQLIGLVNSMKKNFSDDLMNEIRDIVKKMK